MRTIQSSVKQGTTTTELIYSNGRKFTIRYWNKDKDKVISEAFYAVKSIDPIRGPYKDLPYEYEGGWAINVTYYGLD